MDEEEEKERERAELVERELRMVRNMTPHQLDRYEQFRRSHLRRDRVQAYIEEAAVVEEGAKKVKVKKKAVIVMSGLAKLFVGELVESARSLMEERGESGPIMPRHLREVYRRKLRKQRLPYGRRPASLLRS